ncbi:uncharacterized protein Z519_04893 [Cladophialophora bantiana CBS 173.52]|uniref:Biotrophy-associated secreted protein 2 n=1 Tax=Cladophialophora bantiana (strain ATCC 10958 / CBS 173.52 / CDC B-1940 / NIH 8579) TaxID=1442370 RepID=A0A0D2IDR7_CLAB1|nr:uncharacterized protein Z519_04893 [Cladophialophora bantiana CBS 173.52]KIW94914.1 hypothetical protein Z519_04893 [Cladophialophora bantiana CBS 173.52]
MITNTPSKSSLFLVLNLALLVLGQGTQFITGPCTSDADCASSCCGFNSGLCAGPVIAQTRDGGCGFGDAQPNDIAAQAFFSSQSAAAAGATSPATAAPAPAATTAAASGSNNGNVGTGTQFITGPCTSDADCASGCCGFNTGKCAGAIVAQERDGGCGFGDAQPNDNAARILRGEQPTSAASSAPAPANSASTGTSTSTSGSSSSGSGTIDTSIPGSQNVGKANGSQFITGQCFSDADCASGCCGFNTGKCAGAIIAQTRDGGCGFGDAQPNDNAAKALTGGAKKRRGIGAVREYMA